jgi:hypothetical protein
MNVPQRTERFCSRLCTPTARLDSSETLKGKQDACRYNEPSALVAASFQPASDAIGGTPMYNRQELETT